MSVGTTCYTASLKVLQRHTLWGPGRAGQGRVTPVSLGTICCTASCSSSGDIAALPAPTALQWLLACSCPAERLVLGRQLRSAHNAGRQPLRSVSALGTLQAACHTVSCYSTAEAAQNKNNIRICLRLTGSFSKMKPQVAWCSL